MVQAEAFPVRLLPRLGISFVTPDSGPVTGGHRLLEKLGFFGGNELRIFVM